MKHRLLCACACLALAVIGLTDARAENPEFQTISQLKETCPNGWQETVYACGREISIDLDVTVPDVECFPVMEADPIPLAEGRSAEASVITGDVEQWMSTGFLRIDVPNRLVKSAAQKAHPASAAPGGYNQYPILRQFGEFDPDTAYAFNNRTTVADAQQLLLDAWESLYPGEDIALLPHRLIAYQGDMKYDYRTDTYSGDPCRNRKRRSWSISISWSRAFPSSAEPRRALRATPVQTTGRRSGITAPSLSRRG